MLLTLHCIFHAFNLLQVQCSATYFKVEVQRSSCSNFMDADEKVECERMTEATEMSLSFLKDFLAT